MSKKPITKNYEHQQRAGAKNQDANSDVSTRYIAKVTQVPNDDGYSVAYLDKIHFYHCNLSPRREREIQYKYAFKTPDAAEKHAKRDIGKYCSMPALEQIKVTGDKDIRIFVSEHFSLWDVFLYRYYIFSSSNIDL